MEREKRNQPLDANGSGIGDDFALKDGERDSVHSSRRVVAEVKEDNLKMIV